jgi:hypothetical protein
MSFVEKYSPTFTNGQMKALGEEMAFLLMEIQFGFQKV